MNLLGKLIVHRVFVPTEYGAVFTPAFLRHVTAYIQDHRSEDVKVEAWRIVLSSFNVNLGTLADHEVREVMHVFDRLYAPASVTQQG